ncbi:hypothetical protein PROFUN_02045 [Planoprotostelium fungivorum]|uniref:Uncharacterized protein n=1 Tax=Planoprotostelium fungivorum TaxID=1890364 RepID=A0A2P6NB93_9EUKA|nr:hypothetical protein PROFUN_02045 [Planoprotostelium fungivorum]
MPKPPNSFQLPSEEGTSPFLAFVNQVDRIRTDTLHTDVLRESRVRQRGARLQRCSTVELWALQNPHDPILAAFYSLPANVAQQKIVQYHQHCTAKSASVTTEPPRTQRIRQPVVFEVSAMIKQATICMGLVWLIAVGGLLPKFAEPLNQLAVFYYKWKGEELDNIIKRLLDFHSLWQIVLCVVSLWFVSFAYMVYRSDAWRWVTFFYCSVVWIVSLIGFYYAHRKRQYAAVEDQHFAGEAVKPTEVVHPTEAVKLTV